MSNDGNQKDVETKRPAAQQNSPDQEKAASDTQKDAAADSPAEKQSGPDQKKPNCIKNLWQKFKNRRRLPLEIRKWLFFSVFYTIIAVPVAVIYDLIRGFRLEQLKFDWVPDILLANFAVSVNVLSLVEDKKSRLSKDDDFRYSHRPYLMMIITLCVYSFIYRDKDIATHIIVIILVVSALILIANIRMGINVIKKSSDHTGHQESLEGGN